MGSYPRSMHCTHAGEVGILHQRPYDTASVILARYAGAVCPEKAAWIVWGEWGEFGDYA